MALGAMQSGCFVNLAQTHPQVIHRVAARIHFGASIFLHMTDLRSLISELVVHGLDPLDAADIIARAAVAGAASAGQGNSETADVRKKRLARERTERWRASQSVTKASPGVTDNSVTERHQSVTERHEASPLTRVGDNKLTTIPLENHTTLYRAHGFSNPIQPEELEPLRAAVWTAAGDALDDTAIGVHRLGGLIALLSGDKPCDLECDVLPLIRARAARGPKRSIKTWDYFRQAALEARDKRLQANPDVIPLDERRRSSAPAQQVEDEFEAAKRRVIEKYQ